MPVHTYDELSLRSLQEYHCSEFLHSYLGLFLFRAFRDLLASLFCDRQCITGDISRSKNDFSPDLSKVAMLVSVKGWPGTLKLGYIRFSEIRVRV